MSNKETTDKCTRDMMSHSATCAFYPKNKITKCLKEASAIHTACVTGVSSGDSHTSNFPVATGNGMSGNGYITGKYGRVRIVKNPRWYPGCQTHCSYYIPEYLYYDSNNNLVQSDGTSSSDGREN